MQVSSLASERTGWLRGLGWILGAVSADRGLVRWNCLFGHAASGLRQLRPCLLCGMLRGTGMLIR